MDDILKGLPKRVQRQQGVQQQQMPGSRSVLTYGCHALLTFTGVGGVGVFLRNRGFQSFVRNGAGDYSFLLSDAIDTTGTQYACFAQGMQGAVGTTIDCSIVDATHVRVRTGASAVATDMLFTLMILDLGVV